ncbi:ribonuclease protein [Salix suchowensis]|nr:ribonuclease protein [Salix suchowensis]
MQEQGLWAQVFKAKYLKHGGVLTKKDLHHKASSSVWRGVLYGFKALANGITWRISSGDDVLFWTDNWLSCGALRQWATIDVFEELLQTKVSDFLDDGVWDTVCLIACLPDNIVKLITGMHAGLNVSGVDKRIWKFTSNGYFSVKTAYSSLMKDNNLKLKWQFLWKLKIPPKVKTFLWALCHKKILTNAQRHKRGFTLNEACLRCSHSVESIEHLFKDCHVTHSFLCRFGSNDPNICHSPMEFDDWLFLHLQSNKIISYDLPWFLVFSIALWFIWKWRCKLIFEQGRLMPVKPLHLIFDYTLNCYKAQIPKTDSIEHTVVYLHWKPPKPGVCKVNTDGSRINVTGISGAGGVLRDSNGAWIQGFSVNLGANSILEAEL